MIKKTVFVFALLVLVCSGNLFAENIILGNGEWKPYQSKDFKNGGFCTDVVSRAFKESGYNTEFRWYGGAWKRAYSEAAQNQIDGTLVWSYKESREKEMYYSKESVLDGKKDYIYFVKGNGHFAGVEDLYGKRIGGILGYTYGKEVDKAIEDKKINMDRTNSEVNNFKKMLIGRIDCLICGEDVADEILEKQLTPEEKAKIIKSPEPIRIVTYHLLLNRIKPENKVLIDKFDEGLKKLKESGVYQDLLSRLHSGWYEK
ncbi:MAG: transporter substrate-binding domain-containing protein [Desulfobacteraceae bacterium]|nr:transporter substrate-binding domain-containing protein [Desulfobacteraceae bacterium]MCB9495051.1 transporter substrate-binding domain-containing protein [Desulfobacteraceae bacterium]